jgi:DNA polymerase III subunit epsilon
VKADRRFVYAIAIAAIAVAAWIGFTGFMLWSALEPGERQAFAPLLGERLGPLVVLAWLVATGLAAFALQRAHRHFIAQPARLLEQAQVMLGTDVQRELLPFGSTENQGLAKTINELVSQRTQLRREFERKVQEASRDIERERNRLAALMSELSQSVVVCNLNGRILLYNHRARSLFRALSPTPAPAQGAELMGLGRSIYAVFDRRLVDHALENIRQRLQRDVADPSTQFVTSTPAGQLLRVQMAPVHDTEGDGTTSSQLDGFVLMFDNITQALAEENLRDNLLQGLTDHSRASLANIRAAIEMLDYPDLEAGLRGRFQAVIRDEVGAMSERIQDLAARTAQGLKTRWPLEDMLGADLVSAAARRIGAVYHLPVGTSDVDVTLWLKVDSFSLLQALTYLSGRLLDEFAVRSVQLRLACASGRAQLDLVWSGQAVNTETTMSWEMDPMRIGQDSTPLTVRDVIDRHGGEFWFERERVRHEVFFRFVLPIAAPQAGLDAAAPSVRSESRPEYYDFDLFQTSEYSRELDDRALAELTYTVFDTETTGLDPSRGDEIIQIGAVRIVNGKLLTQEVFEQLIDPRRPISSESMPIHGIRTDMLAGKPTIEQVLPAFHAFAQDTVLVAHNAAFDMRFLQVKEPLTGVCFDQPVLDTLLLSALVHPNQESHHLEAIAERFDVTVTGRHTAMGDALVAAQIFLKLIPLLHEHGIHTLGQARAAAQETYYARVRY